MRTGFASVAPLRLRRRNSCCRHGSVMAPLPQVAPQTHPTAVMAQAHPAAAPSTPAGEGERVYVKSPIVGTFYEASSPEAPPFVKVGDRVTPGQVLCIIESMKLMNEIECEVSGTLVAQARRERAAGGIRRIVVRGSALVACFKKY